MREISYIIAFFAGLFLLTAAIAWFKIYRDPKGDLTVGGVDSNRLRSAAMLTAASLGLSGLAALFAVIAWFLKTMLA